MVTDLISVKGEMNGKTQRWDEWYRSYQISDSKKISYLLKVTLNHQSHQKTHFL